MSLTHVMSAPRLASGGHQNSDPPNNSHAQAHYPQTWGHGVRGRLAATCRADGIGDDRSLALGRPARGDRRPPALRRRSGAAAKFQTAARRVAHALDDPATVRKLERLHDGGRIHTPALPRLEPHRHDCRNPAVGTKPRRQTSQSSPVAAPFQDPSQRVAGQATIRDLERRYPPSRSLPANRAPRALDRRSDPRRPPPMG